MEDKIVKKVVYCRICGTSEVLFLNQLNWGNDYSNYTCSLCFDDELNSGYDDKAELNGDYDQRHEDGVFMHHLAGDDNEE